MNKIIHYIGLDVHKDSISVAIAVAGGEVRHYGKIGGKLADIDKLIKQLQKADAHTELRFCYEAGPTGYGLHRHLTKRKFACIVVAPSLTPRKASDRVKNDRRDAQTLARLYRAGELTSIHIPDPEDEAIRDLVRARFAAVKDQRVARQRLKGLLLRLDFRYTGKSSWTPAHLNYLADLKMPSPAQQLVFEEDKQIITLASERLQRFTTALPLHLADWKWKPVVRALMCLRGVDVIHAMTLIAELGDLSRFDNPTQLMGFLGLTPSEDSTGQRRRQGSITKAGNEAARRALVEAAHQYRQPARLSPTLQQRQHGQSQAVRAIAWKAQLRLCTRFRTLQSHRKISQVILTAVARELSGFVWAIACTAMGKAPKPQAPVPLATARFQSKSEKKPKSKVYVLKPQLKLPKRSAK